MFKLLVSLEVSTAFVYMVIASRLNYFLFSVPNIKRTTNINGSVKKISYI